ncbi:MAG: carbon storage regulator [Thermoanaerobaculia bacterium]
MLVLSRKRDDEILIGDVVVKVLKLTENRVQLGVEAPSTVPILRKEAATPAAVASLRDRLLRRREERAALAAAGLDREPGIAEPAA